MSSPFNMQALDFAGTYGVLSLFGLVPAAAVWSQRYGNNNRMAAYMVRFGSPCSCCESATAKSCLLSRMLTASSLSAGSSWGQACALTSRLHSWRRHLQSVCQLDCWTAMSLLYDSCLCWQSYCCTSLIVSEEAENFLIPPLQAFYEVHCADSTWKIVSCLSMAKRLPLRLIGHY